MLLDLGVSSHQLDEASRVRSFMDGRSGVGDVAALDSAVRCLHSLPSLLHLLMFNRGLASGEMGRWICACR